MSSIDVEQIDKVHRPRNAYLNLDKHSPTRIRRMLVDDLNSCRHFIQVLE